MAQCIYQDTLQRIHKEERGISLNAVIAIEESFRMVIFLRNLLSELKVHVLRYGFSNDHEEIEFFKKVKPKILGKLVYYNKISRIETACPVKNGKLYHSYFSKQLQELKHEYREHIGKSEFYRYYRSGRIDRDDMYFKLGKINLHDGLNSYVFEIDPQFSTYYDYKIARIIANDLIYNYLTAKIEPDDEHVEHMDIPIQKKDIYWTDSKNALIELIYALHVSGSISNGRTGLRKLSAVFQEVFRIQLGDVHHAYHRMKDRVGDRTSFLNHLRSSLEQHMNKTL